jgi:DNA polymerase III epsilon subunit-like protein
MMPHYLICDCESSGLFNYDKPADAPGQPRIAQIGLIFVSHDFKIEAEHEFLIKPEGWEMSEEAAKVTGLTTEYLKEHGGPIADALALYNAGIDARRVVVGHNVDYDVKCLRGENRRAGLDDRYMATRTLCTMRASTDICQIPPNGNRGGYKWPKLSEACLFFGIEQPAAHSALADARSAYQILLKLVELGALPEPKSPYDRPTKKLKPAKVDTDGEQ